MSENMPKNLDGRYQLDTERAELPYGTLWRATGEDGSTMLAFVKAKLFRDVEQINDFLIDLKNF